MSWKFRSVKPVLTFLLYMPAIGRDSADTPPPVIGAALTRIRAPIARPARVGAMQRFGSGPSPTGCAMRGSRSRLVGRAGFETAEFPEGETLGTKRDVITQRVARSERYGIGKES